MVLIIELNSKFIEVLLGISGYIWAGICFTIKLYILKD